ncbi:MULTISPECIES: sugar ABC transporter substrate-binding protein [unclassified Mesorhizobium]|uniref:sugar ABC transporter substrate-binding protein n=1 Tax=unclassified Mesorhizobium TaxID=325217 RepID=UPI000FCBA195|nr:MULTISPECIES: sugar ABC transporter substrate-binding protein [unclassified Mesorhizobium]RUW49753.1 sugar ABC transporter substrate-binding protein [Mesorhizobium sp. M8A.F.Ca.ET.021.01.1.1]RUX09441.1 sugar ABC transporter substrate-binding protein [Mesorhizobium sp. M8A.F.Ca.ET.059.01.1.1]TGP85978.1 sugar ABC transporter substrate-binding protein [Mesorhizobium sp. M8A.F.Ca.ET.218.01.1.1]TGT14888.1 sugar ABC transporter substrate-binding protein [Mesorhizobium sp. M8A.F.Ca.ET.213.01.1.1]
MMIVKYAAAAVVAGILSLGAAHAQEGMVDELRQPTLDTLAGKKVIFVPMSMSFDLPEGWAAIMQKEATRVGYTLDIRDANWSTDTGTRALTQAITEKPDVIVVQNFDVASYARTLKKAEDSGIKVIQVNMKSSYQTDAFVGADWYGIGQYAANRMIEKCGKASGKSGKIAIIQGPATAAASVYQLNAISETLKGHDDIKIVSSQTGDWDQSKARGIAQTVIQQNPDLCGIIGFWDVMDAGTGAAIQESGKDIYLITSGGGNKTACQGVENGTFKEVISYDVEGQGRDLNNAIKVLLQSKEAAGAVKFALYTPNKIISKDTMSTNSCWDLDQLKK